MDIEDLDVYQIAVQISDLAWDIYQNMPREHKYKTGQQFLSSADSVGANIVEGYGRYHYKDSTKFYYNSRGSLYETAFWSEQILKRGLMTEENNKRMNNLIIQEKVKLNRFINSIKSKTNSNRY